MEMQICRNVIAEMKNEFDSHAFILVLLQRYAAVYGQYLVEYNDVTLANAGISNFLRNHTGELCITQGEDVVSPNILGKMSKNASWRKN